MPAPFELRKTRAGKRWGMFLLKGNLRKINALDDERSPMEAEVQAFRGTPAADHHLERRHDALVEKIKRLRAREEEIRKKYGL